MEAKQIETVPNGYAILGFSGKYPKHEEEMRYVNLVETVGKKENIGKPCELVEYKGLVGYLMTNENAIRLLSFPNEYWQVLSEKDIKTSYSKSFKTIYKVFPGRKITEQNDGQKELKSSIDEMDIKELRLFAETNKIAIDPKWQKKKVLSAILVSKPELIIED